MGTRRTNNIDKRIGTEVMRVELIEIVKRKMGLALETEFLINLHILQAKVMGLIKCLISACRFLQVAVHQSLPFLVKQVNNNYNNSLSEGSENVYRIGHIIRVGVRAQTTT